MFIAYEASISLSIGLATTNAQSVEVSLVNYLWPTLLVLMTAAVSHKRGAVAKAIPGAVIATIGVAMAVGGESLDMQEAVHNIASNPLPYVLAFVVARPIDSEIDASYAMNMSPPAMRYLHGASRIGFGRRTMNSMTPPTV